jgi:hypothetical protein
MVLFLASLCAACPVRAFIDQTQVIPSAPAQAESFRFSFRTGDCHAVIYNVAQPLEQNVVGRVIELTYAMVVESGSWCIYPTATHTATFTGLPAGDYRVDLYSRDVINNSPNRVLRSQLAFTVVTGQPEPRGVSANSSWAMILLCFGVGLLAVRRLIR